ncbi:MAG: D-mannonate epimerase [Pirellulaceae bacterium]|jgi:nickel-dependent lactate racemase|nr:D-mannonate epimerase [Pirellulaceae bacterium]MDP7019612.1 D-mannonate epimerase [Pirellulaceae bacterium]
MTIYLAEGSVDRDISDRELGELLVTALRALGTRERVLALPPDFTRYNSRAGLLTCAAHSHYGDRLTDVMPALGTHFPMEPWQVEKMFPGLPSGLIREHRWRDDVVTIGEVPAEFVREVTEGICQRAWPAQLNKLLWEGGHDLILSIGQVVPHEVIGMANYNKNVFVGTGGAEGINESHFIGAAYGMERMMGRADTPLRRILNYAQDHFCTHLPLVYVLTVVGVAENGRTVTRGVFVGDDHDCFERAAELAVEVNFTILDEEFERVVVLLDPEEFHSTWLGNKAVYRTRMAIADQGQLIVLAPAVRTFGEDPQIDQLIRAYGYRTTPEVMAAVKANDDLRDNLSAAAHLIHGSSENRFTVTYCPGRLTEAEVRGVGYDYADLETMQRKYDPNQLRDGWNEDSDGRFYFIRNPALGLWAHRARLES